MIDHKFEDISDISPTVKTKQHRHDWHLQSAAFSKPVEVVEVRHSSWTVSDTRAPGRMPFANFAA